MNRKFTNKDLVSLFPLITILVYIFGYLIISGFLSQYDVLNDEFLSAYFLKAGLIFVIVIIPILVILYLNYEEPTDNLLKAKKYYPTLFINVISYLFWLSLFLIDLKHLENWERTVFLTGFILDNLIYFVVTSYAFRSKSTLLKFVFQIIIPIFILGYLGIQYTYLGFLYFLIILTSSLFVSVLGVIADKKYSWGHFTLFLIYFCFLSYSFGLITYGNLPSYLGGGAPHSTNIIFKSSKKEYLKKLGFKINDTTFTTSVKVLYISSDKYLINTNGKIFNISKDLFNGFLMDTIAIKKEKLVEIESDSLTIN